MKFLAFGDVHAHNWPMAGGRNDLGLNPRFAATLNALGQVRDAADEHNVDIIICLGDVFESRLKLDIDVAAHVVKTFHEIADVAPLYMLCGNHDQFLYGGSIHSLELFSAFATVVSSPVSLHFHGLRCGFHPYTHDLDSFRRWLEQLPPMDVLFMHQSVVGALRCRMLDEGELVREDLQTRDVRFVVSGHIHKRQIMQNAVHPDVHFPGSLLQNNFGEAGNPTAVSVCENEDGARWEITEVSIDGPRFHSLELTEDGRLPDLSAVDLERDYVIVRFATSHTETVLEFKDQYPQILFEEVRESRAAASYGKAAVDDRDLLSEYVIGADCQGLVPEKLVEVGAEIWANKGGG